MKSLAIMTLGANAVRWTADFGSGETGIIDALTPVEKNCEERLWQSPQEIKWQMDMFSRTFDRKYYDNAVSIIKDMKGGDLPRANAWEMYDSAFSFPRVRRYDIVNQNMDMLEHFQDNLNTNISNLDNVANFIRVGQSVKANLKGKYQAGEFDCPCDHDPREEAWDSRKDPKSWA